MKTLLLRKKYLIGVLGLIVQLVSISTMAATATFDAVITAGGTETRLAPQTVSGQIPEIAKFDTGCPLACGKRSPEFRASQGEISIPQQYDNCQVNLGAGNKAPGLSIVNVEINSPASQPGIQIYSMSGRTLRYNIVVGSKRLQGAKFKGQYQFHLLCPKTLGWQQTQTKTITVDSKNGYGYVADYTGLVGSGQGFPGTAVVDNSLFSVKIFNSNPIDADITAGMFNASPADGIKGPKLFALYEPTNINPSVLSSVSTGNDINYGGGISVADIDGNGIQDLLLAAHDGNDFTYQIGWDIDSAAQPKTWSAIKRLNGYGGDVTQGSSVAMFRAPVVGAPLEVVFARSDLNGSNPSHRFEYHYGTMDAQGDFTELGVASTTSIGKYLRGIGVELYDVDNNGRPEIVLSGLPRQGGEIEAVTGWNLNTVSGQATHWTELSVIMLDQNYLVSALGAGVAMANLDRNPAPEVVFTYIDPNDGKVYTTTGWNMKATGDVAEWSQKSDSTGVVFPLTTSSLDFAFMDMDVNDPAAQRGSLAIEKSMIFAGVDAVAGVDNVNYRVLRHMNARDLIVNGNFKTNTALWHLWGVTGPYYTQGSLCGANGNLGTNPWSAGFQTKEAFTLETGKSYKMQFDLWSPADAAIGVKLGNASGSLVYGQNLNLAVRTGWHRYTLSIYMNKLTDANAKLEFFLGTAAAPASTCVDNVRVYHAVNTANDFQYFTGDSNKVAKNGSFDFGTMAAWVVKTSLYATSVITTAHIKNKEICIKTPSTSYWWTEVLAQNNITLEQGAVYDFSFDASGAVLNGTGSASLSVKIGSDVAPYQAYFPVTNGVLNITLKSEKTKYTYSFTMNKATTNNAGLGFFTGANVKDTEICLDNVLVTKR